MEYSQKIAVLTQEVMEELANLSKQRRPLTSEFLQEALVKRKGVARLLETEEGRADVEPVENAASPKDGRNNGKSIENVVQSNPPAPPRPTHEENRIPTASREDGRSQVVIDVLRRMGILLAMAAKQDENREANECLDQIKVELKREDTDAEQVEFLLDQLRNIRLREENGEDTPGESAPRRRGIEIAEPETKEDDVDRLRSRVEYLVERLRAILEKTIGQLSLPENKAYSEKLSNVSRKLNQNPSIPELEVLEQQVYELLVSFRQEVEKERDNMSGLLLDVAHELVATEKEFLWTLLMDRKRRREGDVQVEQTIRQRVQAIENSFDRETDVGNLQELVKKGMNGIRQFIVDWRKRQENIFKESEVKIVGLRTRLKKSNEELDTIQQKAEEDPLTGVMNRRSLDRHIKRLFEECAHSEMWASFIMLDIDNFKSINDTYGHLNGDKVLAAMCRAISASLRQGDLFFRYGGDEFSILLPGVRIDDARVVAEKILNLVNRLEFISKGSRVPVSISVGVTELQSGDTEESMIHRADEALYCAKEKGRSRVELRK